MKVNTTSFSHTPQAKDDLIDFSTTGLTEDTILPIFLNVMGNDLGGNAKTLWSLDDANSASTPTSIYAPADLISQDTARTEVASIDYSANGAHIWITSDGRVGYNLTTANPTFKAALQALAVGEFLTDTFTYAIRMGNGTLSWATATVKIAGSNDGILITSPEQSGTVTEDADTSPSTTDSMSSSGLILFKDIDLSDTHTATFTPNTDNTTALGTFVLTQVNEADNAANGSVQWTYNLNNAAAQYLAHGQTVVEHFTVTINDGHGNIASQSVAVTITGTNDAPIILSETTTGEVTEELSPGNLLSSNGSMTFSDVDLTDIHLVSTIGVPMGNALGALTVVKDSDTTGTGTGGQFTWTYIVADAAVEYLAVGQTKIESFTITLDDQNGGIITKQIDITITGTNDAPIIDGESFFGTITEALNPSNALSTNGTIDFSDVDLNDVHTLGAITASAGSLGTLTASVTADTRGTGNGGVVTWNYSVAGSAVEYLAAGQTKVETFSFDLLDGQGASVTRTVSVTITGTNDAPEVALMDITGAVTEQVTTSGNLTDSGTIAFSDVDLTDVHSIGVITASSGALGTLTASVTTDTTGTGNGGVVTWNYSVAGSAVEYLAAGQTKVETFSFDLLDGQGASVTRTVSVTITGTNDAPEVALMDITGAVTEQVTTSGNLTDSGTIAFSDVDLTDVHSIGVITASSGALGTLTASVTTDTTGTGNGGVVTWNYSVAGSAVEYLAAGQTKVETFSFNVLDGQGGSVTRTVSVNVTGTNDAPIVATVDITGTVTEQVSPAGNLTDSGTIAFSDTDLTDIHSISSITPSSGALGSLSASVSTDSTGSGTGGVITWQYSVPGAAVEYLAAGQTKLETFSFNVLDGQGGSVTRTVNVTIVGTNDAPIAFNDIGNATENGGAANSTAGNNASGNVLTNDTDIDTANASLLVTAIRTGGIEGAGTAGVVGSTLNGRFGTLNIDSTGAYTYVVNQADATVQALNVGGSLTDTFNYTVRDGSLSDNGVLTVTIRGSNDDPVAPNVALQINQLGNGGFEASPDFSGWRVNTATTGLTSGSGTATINRAGNAIAGDSAVAVLTFGGNVPRAYGTGYGPTITSDAFNGRSGDTVKFVYELTSGGDQAIGTGYIRDAQTNAIVQTIFNYQVPFTGSSGVKTVDLTLAQSGNFIIDFRIGSYDATGGLYVGATMKLGFAGIIRDGLSEDTAFTFTGNNFLTGVTDVDGGVPVLSNVSANSAANASLVLSGGNIVYDPRVALNYLAANQEFIDTFSYIVSDGKGGFDTATASVKVIGVNDVPVVASADVTGTVTEQVTPVGNLTNSGTIGFSDVDLTDVHSISAVTSSAGALGTLVASISTDTTGSGSGGVITWNYVVPASAVEYLTAGQTKVETFNFNVLDGNGGVVPRSVSVTINGTSEPINLWNADGNAVDQIGANNGTLFNGVGFAPGHTGQAFSFDGVNDYVRVNDTIRNDFTVTGWLKTTANSPTGNQFYQGNGLVYADVGGVANDFGISILNDRIAFGTGNPDTTIQSNSIVTTGNWVQFAAVRSGSVISIYINGALESTIDTHNALTLNSPTAITLGGNTVDGRYFSGLLDDITFYDHALTPVEIVGVAVGPFV